MNKLEEADLLAVDKELQDLLAVAHFTLPEEKQFIAKVRKELSFRGITLDSLL